MASLIQPHHTFFLRDSLPSPGPDQVVWASISCDLVMKKYLWAIELSLIPPLRFSPTCWFLLLEAHENRDSKAPFSIIRYWGESFVFNTNLKIYIFLSPPSVLRINTMFFNRTVHIKNCKWLTKKRYNLPLLIEKEAIENLFFYVRDFPFFWSKFSMMPLNWRPYSKLTRTSIFDQDNFEKAKFLL